METNWDKYTQMSPFEVKNELIETANETSKKKNNAPIYNVGRGNPNFLNTLVRQAFAHLQLFVTKLADTYSEIKDLGLRPEKKGIADKLKKFLKENKEKEGIQFLEKAVDHAIEEFKFDPDEFVFSLADAALGDFYPVPPRIFPRMEKILLEYLSDVLGLKGMEGEKDFDLFATEGGAAAMVYLFKSLQINKIVNEKDKIAIITPIFSPYLEMPRLKNFDLVEIFLESKEEQHWQISDNELKKLEDPEIKAIYLVNPANPTAIALDNHVIEVLTKFIKEKRPDLIVLTDTVYATFVEKFHSLVREIPHNVICVYSFSKYFGVTGWRLGLIMMNKDNVVDKKIKELSEEDKKEIDERYQTVAVHPREIPFIERLELDSRDEALAHTGGLSGPQQSIMTLFALYELMDEKKQYQKSIREKLKKRITDFCSNLGYPVSENHGNSYYYFLFDLTKVAKHKYGDEFASYLEKAISPFAFLFKLAEERQTILLPGKGFGGPLWSFRASLANLSDDSYSAVGKNISDVLEMFYNEWKAKK